MFKRGSFLLASGGCLLAWLIMPFVYAQEAKAPEWKHGLEFRVRKADEPDFTPKTQKFGSEVFLDKNGNNAVYITYPSALAVAPAASLTGGSESKAPKWLHALVLKVRKAGEADFGTSTPKFGVEVFKDENGSNLIYVSQTGDIAVVKAGNVSTAPEAKAPKWLHGLELKVRKGDEKDFNKDTKRYGIEVFKDENANTMIYITETGAIAVVPAGTGGGTKAPTWLAGLEFRVRKADELDFTKTTQNFGAEIFKDENANNLIYITQTGSIGVIPGGTVAGGDTKAPKWLAGLELKVRKDGEADFTQKTKKYGAEIFQDPNANNLVYISETGALAVIPAK